MHSGTPEPLTSEGIKLQGLQWVKVNNTRSFVNLSCRFCDDGSQESQEHLETCGGCVFERRNLDMTRWKGQVIFWRRMTAKLSAGATGGERVLLLPEGTLT